MFDFLKIKKLSKKELELYNWLSLKEEEVKDHWKKVLNKEIGVSKVIRNFRGQQVSKKTKKISKKEYVKWEHKIYGEMKHFLDLKIRLDLLLKKAMKAVRPDIEFTA